MKDGRQKGLKMKTPALSLAALCCLLLAGCFNIINKPDSPSPSSNKGIIRVSVSAGERTILPQWDFSSYTFVFTSSGKKSITLEDALGSALQELEAGSWTINARGMARINNIAYVAAEGSAGFTVTAGQSADVSVILQIPQAGGNGTLSYDISLPNNPSLYLTSASLSLSPLLPGGSSRNFNLLSDSGKSPKTFEVASGIYLMAITASDGRLSAGKTEVVHIYPHMDSRVELNFANDDFETSIYLAGTVPNPPGYQVSKISVYADETRHIPLAALAPSGTGNAWNTVVPAAYSKVYFQVEIKKGTNTLYSKIESRAITLDGDENIILPVQVFAAAYTPEGPTDVGTITVSPSEATEGTPVAITVTTSNAKYRFREGSLKAVYGSTEIIPTQDTGNPAKYTFTMPAGNTTIKGRFEAKVDLSKITITKNGNPSSYAVEPAVNAEAVDYSVYIPETTVTQATIGNASGTSVKIEATAQYADVASVTYWNNETTQWTSTTNNITLNPGPNTVIIRVRATNAEVDDAVKNYVLTINRAYPDPQISTFRFNAANNDLVADIISTAPNHNAGTITLTVTYASDGDPNRPKTTKWIDNITQLKATFTTNNVANIVTVNGATQTSGNTGNDFRRDVQYTVSTPDGKKSKSYTVTLVSPQSTGLPVIKIDTQNYQEITSKEEYIKTNIAVFDPNNANYNFVHTGYKDEIRGRGNSTWQAPKKPYRIKFNEKQSLFGLEAAKSWVLLTGFYGGVFTDAVGFELEKRFGLPFFNHHIIVEVFLNGNYNGHYLLTEQMQVGEGRINIDKYEDYLVQIDTWWDEDPKFVTTAGYNLPVMIKSPEGLTDYNYIKNDINALTSAMYNNKQAAPNNSYRNLIDIDSFVNFLMIQEIVNNSELQGPNNSYIYKVKGGKLSMAQPWDFNWAYGARNYEDGTDDGIYTCIDRCLKHPFFNRFFDDPVFCAKYKERWNEMYQSVASMDAFIDEMAVLVARSNIENRKCWTYDIVNTDFAKMKAWLQLEIAHLNEEINKY
jgi:hypothetical protein